MPARAMLLLALAGFIVAPPSGGSARQPPAGEPLHRPLDRLLDLYVRDGFVYYNALKADHTTLDRYVTALGAVPPGEVAGWPRERQLAFWINAYNALVLQDVARHYPIRGTAPQYPPNSIRQISGVFERTAHRVAGRALTLDAIEKSVLPGLRDPRAYLALGRGAAGSGRLRSEAYDGERLEEQLRVVARETVSRPWLFRIDQLRRQVQLSPIFGWHEAEFVAAYPGAPGRFEGRSPIERAVLAFVEPYLMPAEVAYLQDNRFEVRYQDFDWALNDLGKR